MFVDLLFYFFRRIYVSSFSRQNAGQSTKGDQMGSSLLDVGTSRITCGAFDVAGELSE